MKRLNTVEKKVDEVEETLIEVGKEIHTHTGHHQAHLTDAFIKMVDERHISITKDIKETKDGVHRIEQFLLRK